MRRVELYIENESQVNSMIDLLKEGFTIKPPVIKINNNTGSYQGYEYGLYILERPDEINIEYFY